MTWSRFFGALVAALSAAQLGVPAGFPLWIPWVLAIATAFFGVMAGESQSARQVRAKQGQVAELAD